MFEMFDGFPGIFRLIAVLPFDEVFLIVLFQDFLNFVFFGLSLKLPTLLKRCFGVGWFQQGDIEH